MPILRQLYMNIITFTSAYNQNIIIANILKETQEFVSPKLFKYSTRVQSLKDFWFATHMAYYVCNQLKYADSYRTPLSTVYLLR